MRLRDLDFRLTLEQCDRGAPDNTLLDVQGKIILVLSVIFAPDGDKIVTSRLTIKVARTRWNRTEKPNPVPTEAQRTVKSQFSGDAKVM